MPKRVRRALVRVAVSHRCTAQGTEGYLFGDSVGVILERFPLPLSNPDGRFGRTCCGCNRQPDDHPVNG
jgi:hypothetical protein